MSKIKTTGDLREFLCSAINGVANGTMDADKARNITKLAAQVNESIYSEIKVARTKIELKVATDPMGSMRIGNPEKEDDE